MSQEVQILTSQILNNAKKEAESIIEEARHHADLLLKSRRKSALEETGKEVSAILKRGQREAETLRNRIISGAERDANWMILSEKERLINEVLDKVKSSLEALIYSKKYVSILESMIVDAGTALGGGKLRVRLNRRDRTLPLKFDVLARIIAEKIGKPTILELSEEEAEFIGGVVLETSDGRIMVESTFEAILQHRERQMRTKIAKILFEDI